MRFEFFMAAIVATVLWSGPVGAQEIVDLQLVAVSATEASALADEIGLSAQSGTGDVEALNSFQELSGEVSDLLGAIANESISGVELAETRPLFGKTVVLIERARRIGEGAGISIDPAVADELVRSINELDRLYYPGGP